MVGFWLALGGLVSDFSKRKLKYLGAESGIIFGYRFEKLEIGIIFLKKFEFFSVGTLGNENIALACHRVRNFRGQCWGE